MAAVSLHSAPFLMSDSIISLLDQSWYSQSILNLSVASSVPASVSISATSRAGVEAQTASRSSEAERVGHEQTGRQKVNGERRRYCVDEAEMRGVFDRFDENADGVISEAELRRYMKCCGRDLSDTEAVNMISCVDVNCDGAVDFNEFLSLYENQRSGSDYADEQKDQSKRQTVEHEEDEEVLLLQAFHIFDRNHDGFISAQELQAVLLNLGMPEGTSLISCEKMIHNVDRNGDGHCDIQEFQELMAAQHF